MKAGSPKKPGFVERKREDMFRAFRGHKDAMKKQIDNVHVLEERYSKLKKNISCLLETRSKLRTPDSNDACITLDEQIENLLCEAELVRQKCEKARTYLTVYGA